MRLLAGFALLFGLVAIAALWQSKTIERMRTDRAVAAASSAGLPAAATLDLDPGWGWVVVGLPSGAEPVAAPEILEPEAAARLGDGSAPDFTPPQDVGSWIEERRAALPDFEVTVRSGQTLSQIALDHYGRCDENLVDQLARYNGLSSPNALRADASIQLPEIEALLD